MAIAGNKLVNLAGAKVLYDDLRARIEALEADIATEDSATATAAHAVGDIILVDGALYSVTAAIAIGDTITAEGNSANVEATTVAAVIAAAVSEIELTDLIDDTAGDGATDKVYSADKVHDLLAALPAPSSIIDDTAGDGDTNKAYSADKVHDLLAGLGASVANLFVAIGGNNVPFGYCEDPDGYSKDIATVPSDATFTEGSYLWVAFKYGNTSSTQYLNINGHGSGYLDNAGNLKPGLHLMQYRSSKWYVMASITTQNGHAVFDGLALSGTYPAFGEHSSISSWSANTQYNVGDWVYKSVRDGFSYVYSFYVCIEPNSDGTFDSDKWAVVGEGYSSSSKIFQDEDYYKEKVGGGSQATPANIRTLDKHGNEWLAGSLTIGGTTLTEAKLQALLALLT